ncbi:MAG: MarR family transcriptional regulator [Clostridiales bacterium]|nr:MarR family transcriptional regulator [Clostridiales bacterium]
MTKYCEINKRFGKLDVLKRNQFFGLLEDEKLTATQLPALEFIIEHDGCTQIELAEFLGITPASVAVSTKRMAKAGLIEKHEDKRNLRQKNLSVTEKGVRAVHDCRAIFDKFDEKMYAGISDDELDMLIELLERIIGNIIMSGECSHVSVLET